MTTTRSSLRRAGRAAAGRTPAPAPDNARIDEPWGSEPGTRRTIVIERVEPQVDGGRHAIKRVVGDTLHVTADIYADGHDLLAAALLVRAEDEETWREAPMRPVDNDRWAGSLRLERNARHRYTVEAWRDRYGSLCEAIRKKLEAGASIDTEIAEGRLLLRQTQERAAAAGATGDVASLRAALERLGRARSAVTRGEALLAEDVLAAARRHPERRSASRHDTELPLMVDRPLARAGAWYELFPRSQSPDPRHPRATTLAEATWRLPQIGELGFDVVYLPPIHPIGRTNRKGRNNSLTARRDDVGSPYAIGSAEGGHDAVAPELGGLEGLRTFREAAEGHGMELALDIAIQASPDHPWVREHPDFFRHAPDGTIKYAENPPKKYQDIYPIEFGNDDPAARLALWEAWLDVFRSWIDRGIHIFRVDNPHTKPIAFWRWLIAEVQRDHPEVIFLAEAFTRPTLMRMLAKIGFTQSYTYFTWRETRDELRDYLTELTQGEMREYFRGNFFTNTPDINPHHTDHGRPAFVVRTVLAATLSSSYGIYSGWELCESARLDDREEYADSEKYEVRARDWDAPGNIKDLIRALNRLRHELPALQLYDNLRFQYTTSDHTLFYRKALPDGEVDPLSGHPNRWRDPVFVAVNTDPRRAERAILHPDLPAVGIDWDQPYRMTDLLSGVSQRERGADVPVDLDPAGECFRIFTVSPWDA